MKTQTKRSPRLPGAPARRLQPTPPGPSMQEIARRINAHLKRFERDPKINAPRDGKKGGLTPYWYAGAVYPGGPRIRVTYVHFQGASTLPRALATAYLAWLDAGHVGKHFQILKGKA